jgi:predicted O-methyltransferase YrrM
MHPVIEEIYSSADEDLLASAISPDEGSLIQRILTSHDCTRTLEIGLANGLSALFIWDIQRAKPEARHVAIDPFQMRDFGGRGMANLARAGCNICTLIEQGSEIALPELLKSGAKFDFALLDGFHTFDQTMVDFYFLNRLVRIGGVIAVDDVNNRSVNRAVRYYATLPSLRIIDSTPFAGPKRRMLNTSKKIASVLLRPLTYAAGPAISFEYLDSSVVRPGLVGLLDSSSMVAFEKIDDDIRSTNWYDYL